MTFAISDITSKLVGGGARPTLFRVRLTFPTQVGADSGVNSLASFMIESASLPSSTIGNIDVSYFGRKMRVAGDRTFDAWQVTVINDEGFDLRQAFELWHQKINGLTSNINTLGGPNPSYYKGVASVDQFSKSGPAGTGNIIRTYEFTGIYPTEISNIDLNWDSTDQIEKFQVNFVYDYYTVSGQTVKSALS